MKRALLNSPPVRQRGAALVEFAAIVIIFIMLLIAIFEFGRVMFTWNAAVEATRRGARLAVVCNLDDAQIKAQMRSILPVIADADIDITYLPNGCDANSCQLVTVKILPDTQSANASQYFLPTYIRPEDAGTGVGMINIINSIWKIPEFSTTLTRESLSSGTGLDANPDCS